MASEEATRKRSAQAKRQARDQRGRFCSEEGGSNRRTSSRLEISSKKSMVLASKQYRGQGINGGGGVASSSNFGSAGGMGHMKDGAASGDRVTIAGVKPRIFMENPNPCTIAIIPGSVAIAYRTSHR
jgi:hypothetical protein